LQTDKTFQLADWRRRPLTPAMLAYARNDTRFLLYIADQLRQLLLKAGASVPSSLDIPLPIVGPQVPISRSLLSSSLQQLHRDGFGLCIDIGSRFTNVCGVPHIRKTGPTN
jgi:hypothetical protein